MTGGAQDSGVEREWTLWSEQRAPNERGSYRYRATFPFLGLTVTAEWTEEMHLCGMGYGDSEWWPLSSCHWNGYQRYITHKGLEWSPIREDDPDDIVWSGLDLLPCPFTGKPAKLKPQGQFIGAPLWRSEAVWISSAGVPRRRWTDAKAMQDAWNRRATPAPAGWQPRIGEEVRVSQETAERWPDWRDTRLWVVGVSMDRNVSGTPTEGLNVCVSDEWPVTNRTGGFTDGFYINRPYAGDDLRPIPTAPAEGGV
jgi:hypothetical protein